MTNAVSKFIRGVAEQYVTPLTLSLMLQRNAR